MEDEKTKKIMRATLEATFQAQEKLRKHLDVLIKENRPIKDDTERDLFFREVTYSTLGLGREHIIDFNVMSEVDNNSFVGIRMDLETVCRWLAYQSENVVVVPMFLSELIRGYCSKTAEVPIYQLWRTIRDNLFTVYPRSLDRATSLSPEQTEGQKSKGYKV